MREMLSKSRGIRDILDCPTKNTHHPTIATSHGGLRNFGLEYTPSPFMNMKLCIMNMSLLEVVPMWCRLTDDNVNSLQGNNHTAHLASNSTIMPSTSFRHGKEYAHCLSRNNCYITHQEVLIFGQ